MNDGTLMEIQKAGGTEGSRDHWPEFGDAGFATWWTTSEWRLLQIRRDII